jgi:hypothetical protein
MILIAKDINVMMDSYLESLGRPLRIDFLSGLIDDALVSQLSCMSVCNDYRSYHA